MTDGLVVAHGLSYGGAQMSTFEVLKYLGSYVNRVYVAVSENADSRFVSDISSLGHTLLKVKCKNNHDYPELQFSKLRKIIRRADFVWISDDAYTIAPKIKSELDVRIVCHLRNYALVCLMWGACYNFREPNIRHCSPLQATRCKQSLNDEYFKLGRMSRTRSWSYKLIDYVKGPLDYYTWPIRYEEVIGSIDGFISVSKSALEIHKLQNPVFGKVPCEVIYDPITAPKTSRSAPADKNTNDNLPTVLFLAYNAIPAKGPHVFLRAIKILLGEGTKVAVKMIGAKGSWVEQYASRLSISDYVTFLDRLESIDDVYRLVANSSVVVVPSMWPEPLGRVAVEANLMGVPVVCSRIGGLPEAIVDGETGYLAEVGSAEDFAEKIKLTLATNFSRARIKALTCERFDSERQVRDLADFLLAS